MSAMSDRASSNVRSADVLSTRDATPPAASFTPLVYGGGPIISEPELVSLFWGPFSEPEIGGMQSYLREFVCYVSGELYTPEGHEPVVWQYGVTGGTVG